MFHGCAPPPWANLPEMNSGFSTPPPFRLLYLAGTERVTTHHMRFHTHTPTPGHIIGLQVPVDIRLVATSGGSMANGWMKMWLRLSLRAVL